MNLAPSVAAWFGLSTPPGPVQRGDPSNFKGKDDLFLVVMDAEVQRRFPLNSALMLDAPSVRSRRCSAAGA